MIAVKNNEVYIPVGNVEDIGPLIKAISRGVCWEIKRRNAIFDKEEINSTLLLTNLLEVLMKKQEQLLR